MSNAQRNAQSNTQNDAPQQPTPQQPTPQQPDTIHSRIRKARQAIGLLQHDKTVTAGPTKYDTITHQGLLAVVDPALDAQGLWHSQSIVVELECGERVILRCITTIYADDGDRVESSYLTEAPVRAYTIKGALRDNMTSWGAMQSYARRMGLMAALGLRDGSSDAAESYDHARGQAGGAAAPASAQPTPDAALAPHKAALDIVAGRIGGAQELRRRLTVIATTEPNGGGMDDHAPTRERLAEVMGGDAKGWRGLSQAAFDALIDALTEWPADL